jgi:uncharacterized membrane protein
MSNPALTLLVRQSPREGGGPADVSAAAPKRLGEVDAARSLALLGMIVFHFVRDLEFFGYLQPGTTLDGIWPVFARVVAGSFLFLAGMSLLLAHGRGLRWGPFLKRLAVIAGAAALITAASYAAMPQAFIYYGILHSIAVSCVVGLLFLRLPVPLILAAAAFVAILPRVFRSGDFDSPWLVWTGLAEQVPRSLDFEPFFPWFAPFLAGMAIARVFASIGLWQRLQTAPLIDPRSWVAVPGRHSLMIYLVHQPILLGILWVYAKLG